MSPHDWTSSGSPADGASSGVPVRVFISYRHDDAPGYARALFDRLAGEFGAENVFLDVVTLEPGRRWLDDIRSRGSGANAFLALIGPTWAATMRERGGETEEDYVRAEIEAALHRGSDFAVIPTLVADAKVPGAERLPPSIRPLVRRQSIELRPHQWDADVEHLICVLRALHPAATPPPPSLPGSQERVAVPASSAPPRPDEGHYEEVLRLMIDDGSVVPFLGPGANSGDRDQSWHDVESGCLPDAHELAVYLAQKLGLGAGAADLAEVSQYMAVERGPGDLYRLLRRTLGQRFPPSSVHRFLATFPATLHAVGLPERYQLIVTTNYDDALERAFEDAEEPYDLAVYMANGRDKGKFVHVPFDDEPVPINVANGYAGFPIDAWGELERSVIVKIHGAVERQRGPYEWRDNYVITEDDYIDYLSSSSVTSVIPQQLLGKLRESHFLFLGHAMRDWNLRVFLQRIFGRVLPNRSWAIQRHADRLEERFWRHIGVDAFALQLGEYVRELQARTMSRPTSPT